MTFYKTLTAATHPTLLTATHPTLLATSLPTLLAATLATFLAAAMLPACRPPEKPVTETEALDFAKTIETSVSQHNQNVLDNVIDPKYFAGLVLRQAGQRFNFTLAQKARAAVAGVHFGADVLAAAGRNGNYGLVRRYEKDGHQHLLFRLVSEAGDLNYHDFELIHGDQGVKAIDAYIYVTGEQLSKEVSTTLTDAEKTAQKTDTDRENDRLVEQAQQYLTGGNPEDALSFFDQITDKARKEPRIQKLHLRIAKKLSDSAYTAALNEYKSNYPQDPFIYLEIFKYDVHQKDFQGSLDALNRFDGILPSDPFLDVYRALLYKLMNNPLQSKLALERLHTWNPLNINVIVELVYDHVNAGHPDSAAMLILEAEQRKIITPGQVDTVKKAYPALRQYLK